MDSTTVMSVTDARPATSHTDAALISTSAQAIAEIIALYRRQFGPNWQNVFTDTVRLEVRL